MRSETGVLSKRYTVDGQGNIVKTPAANMYKGTAERKEMEFSDFGKALERAGSDQAFAYGTHSQDHPDKVQIVKDGEHRTKEHVLARTKEHYEYREKPGILMIDHDPSEYSKPVDYQRLLKVWEEIDPQVKDVATLVRGSVSAGVHLACKEPKASAGYHVYVPVVDASGIPQYGKILFDRLWLAGHGYIALSANGSFLVRTPIDGAVFSPERLDFVGKPVVESESLAYAPPKMRFWEGKCLDTGLLKPLSTNEKLKVEALIAEAKRKMKPASDAKKKSWIKQRARGMAKASGMTEKAVAKKLRKMLRGERAILPEEFVLSFGTGEATVREVVKNHAKYDGKSLADPVEGPAYGKTNAKFWWNGGYPRVSSLAHGVTTVYELPRPMKRWERELENHVLEMNKRHANVMIGGKNRIMRLASESDSFGRGESYEFIADDQLKKAYANTKIQVGERRRANGKSAQIFEDKFTAWHRHPLSTSYPGGVLFKPNQDVPEGCFNLWRGFSVEPRENREIVLPVLGHIHDVICGGNRELYHYVIRWIAFCLQHPEKPIGVALVLRGNKGCGKGTLGSFVKNLFGRHGLHLTSSRQLTGNFNGHLADVCYVFADEAFFSGDKQGESTLKGYITENTFMVERKGVDAAPQVNCMKVIIASNDEHVVPASRDERRYCVVDVSDARRGDFEYFDKLHAVLESKEVQAAFLHRMLQADLTGWRPGQIPETEALKDQRRESMGSVGKWLVDSLAAGYFSYEENVRGSFGAITREKNEVWREELATAVLHGSYLDWCKAMQVNQYDRKTASELGKYLAKMFKRVKRIDGGNGRGFAFGDLDRAKAAFEAYEKVNVA